MPDDAIIGGTGDRAMVMVMVAGQQQPGMVTAGGTSGCSAWGFRGYDEGVELAFNFADGGG